MGKTVKKFKGKVYKEKDIRDKAEDKTCLHGGSCHFCRKNRTFKNRKRIHKDDFDRY